VLLARAPGLSPARDSVGHNECRAPCLRLHDRLVLLEVTSPASQALQGLSRLSSRSNPAKGGTPILTEGLQAADGIHVAGGLIWYRQSSRFQGNARRLVALG
jgi:hypothetical protein